MKKRIQNKNILKMLKENLLSQQQVDDIFQTECSRYFENERIYQLFKMKLLNFQQVYNRALIRSYNWDGSVAYEAYANKLELLQHPTVFKLITEGFLTTEDVLTYEGEIKSLLEPMVLPLILNKFLSIEEIKFIDQSLLVFPLYLLRSNFEDFKDNIEKRGVFLFYRKKLADHFLQQYIESPFKDDLQIAVRKYLFILLHIENISLETVQHEALSFLENDFTRKSFADIKALTHSFIDTVKKNTQYSKREEVARCIELENAFHSEWGGYKNAIDHENISQLGDLAQRLSSPILTLMLAYNNFEAFFKSSINGKIKLLDWFKQHSFSFEKCLDSIGSTAFLEAAKAGTLETLDWFKQEASAVFSENLKASEGKSHLLYHALEQGNDTVLTWMKTNINPTELQHMIGNTAYPYNAILTAIRFNKLNSLEWIKSQVTPALFHEMLERDKDTILINTCYSNNLELLKWFQVNASKEDWNMLLDKNADKIFEKAITDNNSTVLAWIKEATKNKSLSYNRFFLYRNRGLNSAQTKENNAPELNNPFKN